LLRVGVPSRYRRVPARNLAAGNLAAARNLAAGDLAAARKQAARNLAAGDLAARNLAAGDLAARERAAGRGVARRPGNVGAGRRDPLAMPAAALAPRRRAAELVPGWRAAVLRAALLRRRHDGRPPAFARIRRQHPGQP